MAPDLAPMIPFVTGWLTGVFEHEGRRCMRVTEVRPVGLDAFQVALASGLVLEVKIRASYTPKAEVPR